VNNREELLTIKRILVALDASPNSLAALEAAVDLATRFDAELAGLFVEDENIFRLADLPFVNEVGYFTGISRQLGSADLQRQLRVQSRMVRRIFSGISQRAQIRWQFHTARGPVVREVLTAASEADVLVLGRTGKSLRPHSRLGSTVSGILREQFGLLLIMHEGHAAHPPLAIVYDGSPTADRALRAAQTLNRQTDKKDPLLIILLAQDIQNTKRLQKQAKAYLDPRDSIVRFRRLKRADAFQINDFLRQEGCGVLVLPTHSAVLRNDLLVPFLENLRLPVLLVT
jgi:nucleotide-binding universal stress UspA family protein